MANRLELFPTRSPSWTVTPWPSANGKDHRAPAEVKDVAPVISFAPLVGDFLPIDGQQGTIEVSARGLLQWYRLSELAFSCLTFRAEKLCEPPLGVKEEKDGDESWIDGPHPLYGTRLQPGLLRRPNLDMRMRAFLWLTSLYWDATGRCVWVKIRGGSGGRVQALRPFSDDDVQQIERGDGRLYNRFRIQTAAGPEWYGAEDVIHFNDPDPSDPMKVVSRLQVASRRLGIDKRLAESIKRALLQAVVPGGVVSFEAELTPVQREEFKLSMQQQYGGAINQGKPLVLHGGAVWNQNELGFRGLEGGKLAEETEARVCMAFGIPPVVMGAPIGLKNSSDRHNLETSRDLFYENAVVPRWTAIEEALSDELLPEFDTRAETRVVRFDRSKVKAFEEDVTEKIAAAKEGEGFLTLDEQRAIAGYDALTPEQREELDARRKVPAPVVDDDPEPAPPKTRKGLPRPANKALDDSARLIIHEAATRAQEFSWELAARELLEQDRDAVVGLARGTRKDGPPEPADEAWVAELIRRAVQYIDEEAAPRWRRAMQRLIEGTGTAGVQRLAADVGISFDLLQPGLRDYTQREAAWLVTEVTDTTKQAIRDALAAGLEAGESIPELTKRIQQSGTFARSRAELIARTETTRVTNGAQVESMQAYVQAEGGTATKRWLATRDARTRDAHLAMDGETVGVGEPFSNGLQAPGEPNCRCTTVLALED